MKVLTISLFVILVSSQTLKFSQGARILALFPSCSKSHKIAFTPIAEALALKGHQITFVSPVPAKKRVENIHEILVGHTWEELGVDWFEMQSSNPLLGLINVMTKFRNFNVNSYNALMANEVFQQILRTKDVDLIIINSSATDFAFPIIDHLNVPFIYFSAATVHPWHHAAIGIDPHYAFIPSGLGDMTRSMLPSSFKNRLVNFVGAQIFHSVRDVGLLPMLDDLARKDFPNARPIAEIERDAQLSLMNHNPATSWPRSFPPNVIPIGPLHTRPAQPLPQELLVLAEGAKDGFIVFTLGSVIPVSSMPPHIVEVFISVFARIPQLVFWKWEKKSDLMDKLPANVKIMNWLPQQDLLGHQNARLFITHGGLVGIQEAVYHGVPLLGLPFGTDQRGNLAQATEEGYAVKLAWNDLTEPLLYDTINALLHNPSYRGNATRLSRLMKDELKPSNERAVYWVEHVLRHGGTKHLQSTAKDMPFYQLYLIDVWAFLLLILVIIIYVTFKVSSWLLRKFCFLKKVKTH